ncbi:MAG: small multi-drug export protein, partial [Candidatus Hydrogenedentes bacterium]|nr:small multi-drug export protein [Candidatus Hydrogenedentota bacterium]
FGGLVTEAGLRRMSQAGYAILGVWAITLVSYGLLWPEPYAHGWWLVLELLAVGRTVCAYEGIRLGFSNLYILIQGGAQDIGICLIIFPWIARFYERVARDRAIDRILRSAIRAAERHREQLQKFGAVGLFFFVFFPVSGTGTLVGSIVGYLIGIPIRLVLPVVIVAHLSSLVFLLVFFDWLEPVLRSVNSGFAQYFAWILLFVVLLSGWLYRTVKSRFARRDGTVNTIQTLTESDLTAEE